MKRLQILIASAGLLVLAAPAVSHAQSLPGKMMAIPNPPGAPQTDSFVVTLPHSRAVPKRALFLFQEKNHAPTRAVGTFQKMNRYQYSTSWKATHQGTVKVQAYTADHQLVAEKSFPVGKAHTNVVGRVILGVVLIGGSLWLWYRQQRIFRPK